jgi:hypothetical protein
VIETTCVLCQQPATTEYEGKPICADCDARIRDYADRLEARVERLRNRADKAAIEARSTLDHAHQLAQALPFGQPILIGHHSEGRDRRYRARIHSTYGRGFAKLEQAGIMRERAEAAEQNRTISSDDPAAVLKLQEKIDAAEKKQAFMKQANAAIRKIMKRTDDPAQRITELANELSINAVNAAHIMEPDCFGDAGFPSYLLTNNNANIRRMKARIEDLKRVAVSRTQEPTEETTTDVPGVKLVRNHEGNRIQLVFDDKPEATIRTLLKQRGFRWSPSQGAWQRQLNHAGEYAADFILRQLSQMDSTK